MKPLFYKAVLAAVLMTLLPHLAPAATSSTFYGIVVHVSTENIKVEDPKTKQTLSFVLVPKFGNVFTANGKTPKQLSDIKSGQYVGIIYDQKALGVRHADKIYLLDNANQRIGSV